ncbi:MAG: hypothetical protein KDK23_10455 [Leptospiraceae bacterium]|nr:hypothetical protein [Leptospiraceae bacterium]
MSQRTARRPSWDLFGSWAPPVNTPPGPDSWSIFDTLLTPLSSVHQRKIQSLNSLRKEWDAALDDMGGDPSQVRWDRFRPLRLRREEDWSDWLAFLLAESRTGSFAFNLFRLAGFAPDDYSNPVRVEREVTAMGFRGDIVAEWSTGFFSHIEVKIGDENLEKTRATGKALMALYGHRVREWTDFILLLEQQIPDWESLQQHSRANIRLISWNDLARALRADLLRASEPIVWRVWAYSFLGAVEMKLLGLRRDYALSELDLINTHIAILDTGDGNG